MTLLYVALVALGVVMAAAALTLLIGLFLPRSHEQTGRRDLPLTTEEAWARLTDFARYPEWQPWLDRVEVLRDAAGAGAVWRHVQRRGERLDLEVIEWQPPRLLVLRTADPNLPFRGTWTLALEPCLGGCRLLVTERGEIPNPVLRTLWRLFRPAQSSVDRFLQAV